MERINCPICDGNNFIFILKGRDTLHHIEGEFDVVKCAKCSLMLTNPRPDFLEIKKYYPDDYNPYELNFKRAKKIVTLRKKYGHFFKLIDPKMTLDLNVNKKKATVLEIGCGAGNFLYELKCLHPDWDIRGVDFNEKSINTIKKYGINACVSNLTSVDMPSESVDIIYGWMIMEHIHDINRALSEIRRILKDNGKFVFSIPNAGSWEFNFFGQNWFALQLPSHLYHFTENTISKILNKDGLAIEQIIHQRNITNIFSSLKIIVEKSSLSLAIKRFLGRVLEWNIIYFILLLPVEFFLAFIKQSGRLTIIASKKNGKK